jgi:RNA polymerase sigma-70 factor (ECF subfamily)
MECGSMPYPGEDALQRLEAADDIELTRRALAREARAFRTIMSRNNRGLYRIARSIMRNDSEAEDVLQEAYLSAFTNLEKFRGESTLRTWLCRIVIHEALGRLRARRRDAELPADDDMPAAEIIAFPLNHGMDDPERTMAQRQILEFVERATDSLPDAYRTVFVARAIEGLSAEETAELLGLKPETVKTRLHRARKLLRQRLDEQIGPVLLDAFPFGGRRCERITDTVMRRLGFAD